MGELAEDDVLRTFIKERELNGDFITKVSDRIWLGEAIISYDNAVIPEVADNNVQSPEEVFFFFFPLFLSPLSGEL